MRNAQILRGSDRIKIILEAARSGELQDIKRIVEGRDQPIVEGQVRTRPSSNCCDIRGKTPLIYATAFGNNDIVEYLLAMPDVDVNAVDDTKTTPLHHASKRASKRREEENDRVQAEIILMLIQAGASLEARDNNGCTPVMFAVAHGDHATADVFIAAGVNINTQDDEGQTPLDYAQHFGHTEMTSTLRRAGAQKLRRPMTAGVLKKLQMPMTAPRP